jgi:hemolysin type calcium-binding protein
MEERGNRVTPRGTVSMRARLGGLAVIVGVLCFAGVGAVRADVFPISPYDCGVPCERCEVNGAALQGDNDDDPIVGTVRRDLLRGGGGSDTIDGLAAADCVFGQQDSDADVFGNTGRDEVRSGSGNDLARGGDGRDEVFGGNGNDRVRGGAGADTLGGADGADVMRGGDQNDTLRGQGGPDNLNCGAGNDDEAFGGPGNDTFAGNCEVVHPGRSG